MGCAIRGFIHILLLRLVAIASAVSIVVSMVFTFFFIVVVMMMLSLLLVLLVVDEIFFVKKRRRNSSSSPLRWRYILKQAVGHSAAPMLLMLRR